MTGPSLATVKVLFARSRNVCAFPGCAAPVIEQTGTVTGEICHIRSASPGGPRYEADQTDAQRHTAANLILMCGRHHKVIDTELGTYTTKVLEEIKQRHEEQGVVEISPAGANAADQLLASYRDISVVARQSNVAVHSPGAIQAQSITFRQTRSKVSVQAPEGSIGASRAKVAYCQYLIDRYQEFQKADWTGKSAFKYAAIHVALKRQFGAVWKLLDEARFNEVTHYLQGRIDSTILGKGNRAQGHPNYQPFETWQQRS